MSKKIDRNGEIRTNFQGLKMKIKEYRKYSDIDVEFENGYIVKNRTYSNFKKGSIKNLYYPNIHGVGFIGEGYDSSHESYRIWSDLIKRCYSNVKKDVKYYGDCYVDEYFHNFQNFARWYEENKWTNEFHLQPDKDILLKNNKVYSPNTIVLVPHEINCLFTKRQNDRGNTLIGTCYRKKMGKYEAYCSIGKGKIKHIGYYNTELEAFEAYKEFKESYICKVANEYKKKYPNFPQILYEAMINYQVEITD